MLTLAPNDGGSALEQLQGDGSSDAFLREVYERIVRFTLRSPPATLVDEICIAWGDQILRGKGAPVEHELLQLAVSGIEKSATGSFVYAT